MGSNLINKKVTIYFDDGNSVTRKDGLCINHDTATITISTDRGIEIIPYGRIVRVEVLK